MYIPEKVQKGQIGVQFICGKFQEHMAVRTYCNCILGLKSEKICSSGRFSAGLLHSCCKSIKYKLSFGSLCI